MSLGQATSFAPNYQKGTAAAGHIKKLMTSKPDIDSYSEEGRKPVSSYFTLNEENSLMQFIAS